MRVYLDTSVVGGPLDVEFAHSSQALVQAFTDDLLTALVSDTLLAEIGGAPPAVQQVMKTILATKCELLGIGAEAIALQQGYVAAGVVTARYADDALHVAQATVARADVIASWNFAHLVNAGRIRGFNGVIWRMDTASS